MRLSRRIPAAALALSLSSGCTSGDSDSDPVVTDTDTDTSTPAGPLELRPDLCADPRNVQPLVEALQSGAAGGLSGVNQAQLERMLSNPADGPFYMFNLIKYREKAEYADGRETDLTGREANALYAPSEYLSAIGARPVFNTVVDNQIDGNDIFWDDVAVVEYPCPIGFLAMIMDPGFQARAVHKDAGVEKTIVIVTDLQPTPPPTDPDQSEAAFPPTEEDPAFDIIHVMDFHEIAQYEEGADEPQRTGAEAWAEYQASGSGASTELGHYRTASLKVQGVFTGDDRTWDEIQIIRMSSQAGFQALLDDETRTAGKYHRAAALEHVYSMITYPSVSRIPFADGGGGLPITDNGTGTPCRTDSDCPDSSFVCLSEGDDGGFCTPASCSSGSCESPYVCCHECSEIALPSLPFEESACIPDSFADVFTADPVSCTCN